MKIDSDGWMLFLYFSKPLMSVAKPGRRSKHLRLTGLTGRRSRILPLAVVVGHEARMLRIRYRPAYSRIASSSANMMACGYHQ
jgi:hypothetical protein